MSEFTGNRYLTKGIQNEIPIELQLILWNMIDEDKQQKKLLDYLQVFELKSLYKKGKFLQEITHKQEQPYRKKKITMDSDNPISAKIFVIDDVSHITMLLSNEY